METVLTLAEDKCVAIDTWDMMCKYVQHLTQRLQGLENPPRTLQLSRFPAKNKTMELRAQINLMRQNADLLFSKIEEQMEEAEMEEEEDDWPMTEVAIEKEIIKEEPLKEEPIEKIGIDSWEDLRNEIQLLTHKLHQCYERQSVSRCRFPVESKTLELRATRNLISKKADVLFSKIEQQMIEEEMGEHQVEEEPMEVELIEEEPVKEELMEDVEM